MLRTLLPFALLISPALAQPHQPEAAKKGPPVRTVYFIGPDTIEGQVQAPEAIFSAVRVRPDVRSLIQIRGSFRPELLRSAEIL